MEELTVETNTKKKSLFWSLLDDKKQKWHVRFRFILVMAIALAAVTLAILVIAGVRLRSTERHLYDTNWVRIDTVLAGLGDGVVEQDTLNEEYDKIYIAKLINTDYHYSRVSANDVDDAMFRDICAYADVESAAIIDGDGKVYASWQCPYDFTLKRFNMLRACASVPGATAQPFSIEYEDGVKRFFGLQVGTDRVLVFVEDWTEVKANIERMTSWEAVLRGMVSVDTVSIAISLNDYTFLYNPIDDLTGKYALQNGVPIECLRETYEGELTFGGETWCAVGKQWNNAMVFVMTKADTNLSNDSLLIFLIAVVLIICVGLVTAYGVIINIDNVRMGTMPRFITLLKGKDSDGRRKNLLNFNLTVAQKVLPIMVMGILAVVLIGFYIQTLNSLSAIAYEANWATDEIGNKLERNTEDAETLNTEYKALFLDKCVQIARMLEENPQYIMEFDTEADNVHPQPVERNEAGEIVSGLDVYGNPCWSVSEQEFLINLCENNAIERIAVFDEYGRIMATNQEDWYFTITGDPEDQSYPFWEILAEHRDTTAQDYAGDGEGGFSQYIGTAFHYYTIQDEDGSTRYVTKEDYAAQLAGRWAGGPILKHRGLLQISIVPERLRSVMETATLTYVASHTTVHGTGSILICDTSPEHICIYSPDPNDIGRSALSIGYSAEAFNELGEMFNGIVTVNGTEYLLTSKLKGEHFIGAAVPTSTVFSTGDSFLPVVVEVTVVALLVVSLYMCLFGAGEEQMYRDNEGVDHSRVRNEQEPFLLTMPSGKTRRVRSAAARWDAEEVAWRDMTPDQKFGAVAKGVLSAFAIFVFLCIVASLLGLVKIEAVNYVYDGVWSRGLNIFALTRCIITLLLMLVGARLVEFIIESATANIGSRAETLGHLLSSVVRYGSALVSIFYALYLFGLDTGSLIASAGILSLIVGLGAQSMIQDILAGLFIVFEGEFRVGDIVTVGDFRGNVLEIGLRTTKIEDPTKNIKVFNNSNLSGIINMTKEASYAAVDVSIEYGESLERVEAVLAAELPEVKNRLPAILDGPFYKGVSALGQNSVDLKITALCKEGDRIQLCRDLYRAVYLIFNKHDINVPFPQITVSYLKEDEKPRQEEAKPNEVDRTLEKLSEDEEEEDDEDKT